MASSATRQTWEGLASRQHDAGFTRRCQDCGAWATERQLLCSECRAPFVNVAPLSERPALLLTFVALLIAVATVVGLIVRAVVA